MLTEFHGRYTEQSVDNPDYTCMWGEVERIVWELGQRGKIHDLGNMQTSSLTVKM